MPKKPKPKPVKMKAISIDVFPDEHERVKRAAAANRISTAQAYRDGARKWARDNEGSKR